MKILFGKFKNAKYLIIGRFWLLYRENSNLNTLENYSFICRNLIFLFFCWPLLMGNYRQENIFFDLFSGLKIAGLNAKNGVF
jgi:hypothetical protein